ncbi:MAG: PAS domain-containing sensor histidine kinase [Planctomycetia bacterium]|jgi:PAS domain S-box-containing protein
MAFQKTGDVDEARFLAELEELRHSAAKYRELVEESRSIVLRLDAMGNVVFANRHALEFFGYSEEDLLGKPVVGTIVPFVESSGRDLAELIHDICDHPERYQDNENENIRHDGTSKWIAWTNRGIRDASGCPKEILCIGNDITARKQAEEDLQREQQVLRHLLESQQYERKLIAFEIHDGLTQMLTATSLYFEAFDQLRAENPQMAEESYMLGRESLDRAVDESRRLVENLRPLALEESGIVEAIRTLIETRERPEQTEVEFVCEMQPKRLEALMENALYRIAQEGLNNAIRHGESERIRISLREQDDSLCLEIRDWGKGFDLTTVGGRRYGLRGIRERARILGGEAVIESAPGEGTRVLVRFEDVG